MAIPARYHERIDQLLGTAVNATLTIQQAAALALALALTLTLTLTLTLYPDPNQVRQPRAVEAGRVRRLPAAAPLAA